MNELQVLYQEVLLDHYRSPRNRGRLADPTGRAEGHNPLCGDRIAVEVRSKTIVSSTSPSKAPAAPFRPPPPRS